LSSRCVKPRRRPPEGESGRTRHRSELGSHWPWQGHQRDLCSWPQAVGLTIFSSPPDSTCVFFSLPTSSNFLRPASTVPWVFFFWARPDSQRPVPSQLGNPVTASIGWSAIFVPPPQVERAGYAREIERRAERVGPQLVNHVSFPLVVPGIVFGHESGSWPCRPGLPLDTFHGSMKSMKPGRYKPWR